MFKVLCLTLILTDFCCNGLPWHGRPEFINYGYGPVQNGFQVPPPPPPFAPSPFGFQRPMNFVAGLYDPGNTQFEDNRPFEQTISFPPNLYKQNFESENIIPYPNTFSYNHNQNDIQIQFPSTGHDGPEDFILNDARNNDFKSNQHGQYYYNIRNGLKPHFDGETFEKAKQNYLMGQFNDGGHFNSGFKPHYFDYGYIGRPEKPFHYGNHGNLNGHNHENNGHGHNTNNEFQLNHDGQYNNIHNTFKPHFQGGNFEGTNHDEFIGQFPHGSHFGGGFKPHYFGNDHIEHPVRPFYFGNHGIHNEHHQENNDHFQHEAPIDHDHQEESNDQKDEVETSAVPESDEIEINEVEVTTNISRE